jgi:hypothetical protein
MFKHNTRHLGKSHHQALSIKAFLDENKNVEYYTNDECYFVKTTFENIFNRKIKAEKIDENFYRITYANKSFFQRVQDESEIYDSHEEAAIDHIRMAQAHMFEEHEGRDIDGLTAIFKQLIQKIK